MGECFACIESPGAESEGRRSAGRLLVWADSWFEKVEALAEVSVDGEEGSVYGEARGGTLIGFGEAGAIDSDV